MGLKEDLAVIEVATGLRPADLVAKGTLLNVYSGELLPQWSVAVSGQTIAYTGPFREEMVGPQTLMLDAGEGVIVPGFIDGHNHLDTHVGMSEIVRYALPTGSTTLVTETTDAGQALGFEVLWHWLDSLAGLPANIFALAPQGVLEGYLEQGLSLDREEFCRILDHPRVIGMSEIYWPVVLERNEELLERMRVVRDKGLQPQGHAAGARGSKLAACVAAGVSSCHEPITPDEALERLRLGIHTMIRQGSVRRDLEAVTPIKDRGIDTRRLIMVSDGVTLPSLLEGRFMNSIVQRAIELGWSPVTAVQMVTLNVAEHFGLDGRLGGIAPGKQADLVVLPDLKQIRPRWVVCQGRLVAEEGKCLVESPVVNYGSEAYGAFRGWRFSPDDFHLDATDREVRVIRVGKGILTTETHRQPGSEGLNRVAVVDRSSRQLAVGLVEGYGLRAGAVAISYSWDGCNPVIIGANEEDMAAAANRMVELGGGYVVCREGKVLAELPLCVGGIFSEESLPEVAQSLDDVYACIKELGSSLEDPLLVQQTVTFTGLPDIRITPRGLFDIRKKERRSLVLGPVDG